MIWFSLLKVRESAKERIVTVMRLAPGEPVVKRSIDRFLDNTFAAVLDYSPALEGLSRPTSKLIWLTMADTDAALDT
jgi:hypothetical protein